MMNNGKYPRTLNEAFGPYTSNKIEEPTRPYDWQDEVVLSASIICFAALIVLMLVS
jgi:hypothetical protein